MSSFCKSYSHVFSKNISVYGILNDQSFNDTLTNDIVNFEQLGPGKMLILNNWALVKNILECHLLLLRLALYGLKIKAVYHKISLKTYAKSKAASFRCKTMIKLDLCSKDMDVPTPPRLKNLKCKLLTPEKFKRILLMPSRIRMET